MKITFDNSIKCSFSPFISMFTADDDAAPMPATVAAVPYHVILYFSFFGTSEIFKKFITIVITPTNLKKNFIKSKQFNVYGIFITIFSFADFSERI